MSVNGPISPKQCYHEIDYSFYSFYWLDSLEIRLDHNSTYYRSLSKNSDVKRRISHCDSQNLQYKTHPEFWPSHRRIFKTSLYYKTRLILETRRYVPMIAVWEKRNCMWSLWLSGAHVHMICVFWPGYRQRYFWCCWWCHDIAGIILGMGLASERWRYNVMSSLIGWAHTQNDPCIG